MDLMVNYNFIVVVSWSFPLSIIDHAHDNVAPLLPKKAKTILIQKESLRYAPAVGSFVIWSWDNSKIHSLIFVFEQEITVISLLSPHPKRIFILSSSKFSKQKRWRWWFTTVLLSLVVVLRWGWWCFAYKIHTALLFFRSNFFEPKVHSCLSDDY